MEKTIKMAENLQNVLLDMLCTQKIRTFVFLKAGARLEGYIQAFDDHTVVIYGEKQSLVYKHAICSIMPSSAISIPEGR